MIPIYYDVSTKTAYYERADASLIIKTNYVPAFKELFDFLSIIRQKGFSSFLVVK